MKRVVWAAQVFPRHSDDPFGSFLLRLARAMPARGWDVTVVAPGDGGAPAREDMDGVHVRRFDVRGARAEGLAYRGELHRAALARPFAFARFLRAFRDGVAAAAGETGAALLHAHWWAPGGVLVRGVARDLAVPWVLSLHGTDVRLVQRFPLLRPVAGRVAGAAATVLPVSAALDREVARWGVAAGRRVVLPMPADATRFTPPDVAPPDAPARFLVVARLTRQKRVADVLHALAAWGDGPEVRLDVCGDGPERAELGRAAAALGERVSFHGMLAPDRLPPLYRAARAVVLPSTGEGYGLAVIEAALCGVPAIVARSGALPDLVEDGRSGLVVPPGDVEALRLAMRRLAGNPAEARALGAAARARAAGATADPLADRLADVYAGATAGRSLA